METITNQITIKLHKEFAGKFLPLAEQLRVDGLSDYDILKIYNDFIQLKVKEFYKLKSKRNSTPLKATITNSIQNILGKDADSKIELFYCEFLYKALIPFEFQYKIGPFRADFLIDSWLVFEIDGPYHDKNKDAFRDKYMRNLGYEVFRVPAWLASVSYKAVIEEIKELIKKNPKGEG